MTENDEMNIQSTETLQTNPSTDKSTEEATTAKQNPDIPQSKHDQQKVIRLSSSKHFKSFSDPFKLHKELVKQLEATLTNVVSNIFINRNNNQ